MHLTPLTRALRKQYQIDSSIEGLAILSVDGTSTAYEKGLREGDVVLSANQQAIPSIKALQEAIEAAKKEKRTAILLLVHTRSENIFIALPIE